MHLALFLQQNSQLDPAQIQRMVIALMAILPVIILLGLAVIVVPFWFICKKAGFSPWLSLLHIVPLGGLILYYVLAFADWKVTPAAQAGWPPPPPYPPQPPYPPHS
jgi:hypothetical protein